MNMLSFGEIEPVWDELFPAEQARIIQLLVERVTVSTVSILDGKHSVVPKQSS